MIDQTYKNALKEVYDILQNTEESLLCQIPVNFMDFVQKYMNPYYKSNIQYDKKINKQPLLKETEAILSLIYRSYWATNSEKQEFSTNDQKEFISNEKRKKEKYQGKDIYQIFEERKNLNNIIVDKQLIVVEQENIIKRFLKKLFHFFKKSK